MEGTEELTGFEKRWLAWRVRARELEVERATRENQSIQAQARRKSLADFRSWSCGKCGGKVRGYFGGVFEAATFACRCMHFNELDPCPADWHITEEAEKPG